MQKKLNNFITQLQSGDAEVFEEFYNFSYRLLYSVAFGVVRRRDLAEDVVQEAYVAIYKNVKNIDIDRFNVTNYLYTITKNKALNILKKQKDSVDVDDEILINSLGDKNLEPVRDSSLLAECRAILNDEEYEIIVLSQIKGFKRREIAEMLASNINTVTWRYQQALKKLKKHIKEGDYEF